MHMRNTRAAYSKQSKQNSSNQAFKAKSIYRQNQKVKSHTSLENVFAIDPFG